MPPAYEVLLLNTAIPQIQAAQSGDTYVVPRDIAFSAALTLTAGTANGVPYLSSPGKVLTTGSALTFNGTVLYTSGKIGVGETNPGALFEGRNTSIVRMDADAAAVYLGSGNNYPVSFKVNDSEQMRLTSTGLGIGTSSPQAKLHVAQTSSAILFSQDSTTATIVGTNAAGTASQGLFLRGFPLTFTGNGGGGAEQMRLDSSGNLGLGVTPSGWDSAYKALQMSNGVSLAAFQPANTPILWLGANAYYDAGSKYVGTGAATLYQQNQGSHIWYNAPSGTADGTAATSLTSAQNGNSYTIKVAGTTDFTLIGAANNNVGTTFTKSGGTGAGTGTVSQNISFTQAMTLDASGNLGVGETNPASKLHVAVSGTAEVARFETTTNNTPSVGIYSNGGIRGKLRASTAEMAVLSQGSIPLLLGVNDAEAARITSGGEFLVGAPTGLPVSNGLISASSASASVIPIRTYCSAGDAYAALSVDKSSTTNTTSQVFAIFTVNAQATGSGQINANGASQAAFGSFSDRRLKENIVDLESQWQNIKSLRPVEFDYVANEGGGHQIGFIAQEVQTAYPDLVGERSDGMLTLSGMGKNEARLIKALQEAMARIEKLEAEVAALKGA